MRPLFEFAERGGLREFVGYVTKFSSVQGVVIDYDPLWLVLWRVKSARGDRAVERLIHSIFDWFQYGRGIWPVAWDFVFLDGIVGEGSEIDPPNPNWIPPHWTELQQISGIDHPYKEPFIVKVCLLPWHPNESVPELGEHPFPVVKERRARQS
jgi:hypothetical protein